MLEVQKIIKKMKRNKAVGRDGFPIEFFDQFGPVLLDQLVNTCNYALKEGVIPESWKEARIIVLPKPGKDPSLVGSYRPISLINHDAKVFATVLAKRLNTFITQYIHSDQTGFMPSWHMTDNICRSLNIIHFCKSHKLPAMVLSLDAEKAFDRVETSYLRELLQTMNFGPGFLNAMKVLYTDPKTQLLVNGIRSNDFTLS